jgi:hypothetical protein
VCDNYQATYKKNETEMQVKRVPLALSKSKTRTQKIVITRKHRSKIFAVAGDRTRVARVTGGNTHHYTTTTLVV